MYTQALNTYQKTAVETADTVQLVIMCCDAAVRDLREAMKWHESGSMEPAYNKIRHAQDIITELLVGLDYERGGEIAVNLSRLYNFMLRQLIGINSRKDTSVYTPTIRILSELKEAWEEIRGASIPGDRHVSEPTNHNWGAVA
jgi:flagellar secretion chaperone FliS